MIDAETVRRHYGQTTKHTNLCYLCALTHSEDRQPALWAIDCVYSVPRTTVYSCAAHYGDIVTASRAHLSQDGAIRRIG